jgi:F-type H+-transporting ATPase subunit b
LEERQTKISSDLDNAEKSRQEAEKIVEEKNKELKHSAEEIRKMKHASRRDAEKKASEIIQEAKDKEHKIIGETEIQLQHEKLKVMQEIEGELTGMIAEISGKFLSGKIDKEQDMNLLNKLIKESEAR